MPALRDHTAIRLRPLPNMIFATRWLQLPLYLGLILVIVGGYETFVSRLNLEGHPDQPEWLSHVNASVLKVKLATAIIGISSIHLLKTFITVSYTHLTLPTKRIV